jgi:zinc transporter, ZIP family
MGEAFFWGFLAASSLIVGGAVALAWPVGPRLLGLVMAFGSGVLISAVAFELVQEAWDTDGGHGSVVAGLFAGSLVFYVGDLLIDRMGGERRKDSGGEQADGQPLAILLGTVLDGIPESIVLGLTLVGSGSVSVAYLVAVFISNVPEAFSSSSGLAKAGWAKGRVMGVWVVVALVSGLSSLLGFAVFDSAGPHANAFVLAFAAGGVLTMLADTMIPEAYEQGGKLVGVVTTFGFAVAFGLSAAT